MSNTEVGPWSVSMLERPQLRPYFVARQVEMLHWEQLHLGSGEMARFETMSEAQAAADEANLLEAKRG